MKSKLIKNNEQGSVLLTVLCVMTVMFLLIGAAINYVRQTSEATYKAFQTEQAYMTASTCLESFVNQIEKDTATATDDAGKLVQKANIDQLLALAASGSEADVQIDGSTDFANMGSCKIKVTEAPSGNGMIIITATANFGSQTEQVCAYVQTESKNKKATLTNCIELTGDGSASYDNLNVIGDMASVTGSGHTSRTYTVRNDTTVIGSSFYYGTLQDSGANAGFTMQQSISDSSVGTNITVSNNLISNNFKIGASIPRADGYNYLNVGGKVTLTNHLTVGTKDSVTGDIFDVDLYCTNFESAGNGYTQYGNLYVYQNSVGAGGDYVNTSGHDVIYGDLYVEGDIKVSGSLKVYGNIYVTGTVTGNVKTFDKTTLVESSAINTGAVMTKTGRGQKPDIASTMNEYVYFPEDMLCSSDNDVGKLKTTYANFYNGMNTKTVKDFIGSSSVGLTDGDGVDSSYCLSITESCTLDAASMNAIFDKYGSNAKVLIWVTNKDIVIRLASDLNGVDFASHAIKIIVKNDSAKTESYEKFCYFVSDSGVGTIGAITSGVSTHSGFASPTYNFQHFVLLSYETYKAMYPTDLLNKTGSLETIDSSFKLNPTTEVITGATKPADGEVIFLMTEGTSFYATNNSLVEATFYAPQGKIDLATGGITIPAVYTSSTNLLTPVSTCAIGAIVAKEFGNANTAYYIYNKPSDNSVLSVSKGAKDDTLNGYKLLRYGH